MDAFSIGILIVGVFYSIVLHEMAHAWMAYKLGDNTAKNLGRISLNPIKHIDLVGTIILPLFGYFFAGFIFGWAKPVPVNPNNLHSPKDKSMAKVAIAGPITNFVLAIVSILIFKSTAIQVFYIIAFLNVLLGTFNLFPVPPLDGGRIMVYLLPNGLAQQYAQLERYGFLIIVGIIIMAPKVIFTPAKVLFQYLVSIF